MGWCDLIPQDADHLLELAIASGASLIVTHNTKDFREAAKFGVRSITPKELMEEISFHRGRSLNIKKLLDVPLMW